LGEQGRVVLAIFVVKDPAAPETELGRAKQKVLPVRISAGGVGEKQLTVEYLWELLVEIDADELAAEAQSVLSANPAHGLNKVQVVLDL
jgi:hypothetical protein